MPKEIDRPIALLPAYDDLKYFELEDYPEIHEFVERDDGIYEAQYNWAQEFLLYIGRNKSEHTYGRFRNEVERFLLWSTLISKQPIDALKKQQVLDYADFCWQPPLNWICLANHEKFVLSNGYYQTNDQWAPFRLKVAKGDSQTEPDKKTYRPSQQTLTATFTALIAFYKFLMQEEYVLGNPAQLAKKDCRYFVKDAQVKEVKRLTEVQWQYVFDVALELANENSDYERSLFIVAALKTLFLRISELSERPGWSPVMSHFWEDDDGNWWLKVFGKGRKIRDITVPNDFMGFLTRYRLSRGLSDLPNQGETAPIVEKLRGRGGMTARQLTRIVQEIFDHAYDAMARDEGERKARKLKEASSHWLRHTGASIEVERGRALKDVSEDLGHSSMATTDSIYVQSENKKRAESGKNRSVS